MSKKAVLLTALLVGLSVLFSGTALAHTSSASGGASASAPAAGGSSAPTAVPMHYVTNYFPTVECSSDPSVQDDPTYNCASGQH